MMIEKMQVSYKKLWHILLDKDMKKKDLEKATNLTHYQMMKLANNQTVTTDVLGSICKVLDCKIEDIMEFVEDERGAK